MNKKFIATSALSLVLSMSFVNQVYAEDAPAASLATESSKNTQPVVPAAEPAAGSAVSATETVATPSETTALPAKSTASDQNNRLLKEMVVSANKDKPIQQRTELGKLTVYTPVSGAVVSKEELEHLQLVNNLLELGKRVPGISMVRNMRVADGGKQYTESRIDGMRAIALNTSTLDGVDLNSVERIDVITGPASALYGSGALGGTISVTTRQPPEKFGARLSQEFGSWGFKRTQGDVGTSNDNGSAGFILTGSTMDNDGWRMNSAAANQNSAAEHKNGAGLKTVFRPTDTTKIYLGYDQLHYDYRWAGPISMTMFNQDWRQTLAGGYGQSIDTYKTQTGRLQQMVGERGEFNFLYGKVTDDTTGYGGAGSGGSNNVICDDGNTAAGTTVAAGKTVRCSVANNGVFNTTTNKWSNATVTNTLKAGTNTNTTTTAMYRHEFDLAKSTLYVGYDRYQTVADTATYNNVFNALQAQAGQWAQGTMTATGQGALTKRIESSPFIHYEFSPMDKLRLHIGERFGKVNDIVDDRTAANKDVNMTQTGNVIRSGVTYEFDQNHLIWSNIAQTFDPPATSTLLDTAAKGTAGNTIGAKLDAERGLTQEVGIRGRFEDIGFQYDVDVYHTVDKNFINSRNCTPTEVAALNANASCYINENTGQITLKGIESLISWAATKWLDVGATYTIARATYNSYEVYDSTNKKILDYSGHSYQAMPQQRLNVRLAVKPAYGWQVELEGDFISSYYVDTANSSTYSRPALYNLRASYRNKKAWSYWMQVLNLTNQQYATRVGYSTIAGQSVLAASAGQGNSGSYTPLTLRAGIAYNFK